MHPVGHHQGQLDSFEVAGVVGDKDGVGGDGVGCDEHIPLSPIGGPSRLELEFDLGVEVGGLSIPGEHRGDSQKFMDA